MTYEELEGAFHGITVPDEAQLDDGVRITNVPKFIKSHLQVIKGAQNARMSTVFEDRLIKLLEIIAESEKEDPRVKEPAVQPDSLTEIN
ncbi:DUF6965 family protein [Pedobacter metabolipauper]|uniref:DUF6965 domain-containing protein n=1 Tax=Pedobacter metabolipauper TaxID=425513 RepID=A0A4V6PW05_9SPHI|nr:hypothetical protein [Pedobacter metabolipauper]TDQ08594.1 hypothetical protein ATK78_3110 [Pedobacter metabolipauper]